MLLLFGFDFASSLTLDDEGREKSRQWLLVLIFLQAKTLDIFPSLGFKLAY